MKVKDVNIEFLGHSGFLIYKDGGKRIAIDPYNVSNRIGKVNLILLTHGHYDHCSIKDIQILAERGTIIIMPADVQSKIMKVEGIDMQIIEAGEEFSFGSVKVKALPAYNVGKDFHPKSEGWLGFLLKIGSVVVYHSGDTDKIPEMKRLTGYGKHGCEFVVMLPVSGKFVMDAEEAADVASLLNPNLVIPMHYGAGVAGTLEDAKKFTDLCKERGLKAEILEKI